MTVAVVAHHHYYYHHRCCCYTGLVNGQQACLRILRCPYRHVQCSYTTAVSGSRAHAKAVLLCSLQTPSARLCPNSRAEKQNIPASCAHLILADCSTWLKRLSPWSRHERSTCAMWRSTSLLDTQSVRSVQSRISQTLLLRIWNLLACYRRSQPLSQPAPSRSCNVDPLPKRLEISTSHVLPLPLLWQAGDVTMLPVAPG